MSTKLFFPKKQLVTVAYEATLIHVCFPLQNFVKSLRKYIVMVIVSTLDLMRIGTHLQNGLHSIHLRGYLVRLTADKRCTHCAWRLSLSYDRGLHTTWRKWAEHMCLPFSASCLGIKSEQLPPTPDSVTHPQE